MIKRFLIAVQFLTILPLRIKGKVEGKEMGDSLQYFPVVGLLIGCILAGISYIASDMPPLVIGILVLIVWTVITGGVHLDGFADSCDGFCQGRSKEDIMRIMHDSRIGAMGAAGIALVLLLKFAVLSSLQYEYLWLALLVSPIVGRWSQVLACAVSKYARDEGKAKYFIGHAKKKDVVLGALLVLLAACPAFGAKGVLILAIPAITALLFVKYCVKRIGGMTGDTIGAVNEIAESAALLTCLAIL